MTIALLLMSLSLSVGIGTIFGCSYVYGRRTNGRHISNFYENRRRFFRERTDRTVDNFNYGDDATIQRDPPDDDEYGRLVRGQGSIPGDAS